MLPARGRAIPPHPSDGELARLQARIDQVLALVDLALDVDLTLQPRPAPKPKPSPTPRRPE